MRWLIAGVTAVLLGGVGLALTTHQNAPELDMIEVNRVIHAVTEEWPAALAGQLPDSPLDVAFIPRGESLHDRIRSRETLVPLYVAGQAVGTVAFPNDAPGQIDAAQRHLTLLYFGQVALLALGASAFVLHQQRTIQRPFAKMRQFASRVADGDLDAPLEMDRRNRFGAFSESFDLMREQLVIARANEEAANLAKKELVASLSHDIKTPITSIKTVAELHQAKRGDTPEMTSIIAKADQIDQLITNLFTATLEDLEQLSVALEEFSATELERDIREADPRGRIRPFRLPPCVLAVDRLRFRQIMDNLIGNAEKYAGTEVEVSGAFDGRFFVLTVRDFGPGVGEHELTSLTAKFFRAENSRGIQGAGLGLHLAAYFMHEMGGSLAFENRDGLRAILRFPL